MTILPRASRPVAILPLLALLLLSGGCKKAEIALGLRLPDETQEGKGTFGCKLDGKLWLPQSDHTLLPSLSPRYSPRYSPGTFTIRASDDHDDAPGYEEFTLTLTTPTTLAPGTYMLGSGFAATYWRQGNDGANRESYATGPGDEGAITITKVEARTRTGLLTGQVVDYTVVSGTFHFTATSSTGQRIDVTSGRFDVDPSF